MDPLVTCAFVDLGFAKQSPIEWCAENAKMPARNYWDDQWVTTLVRPHAVAGVEPHASRLKAAPDELVNIFRPEDINIIVMGGESQGAFKMISGRYLGRGPGTANAEGPTGFIDIWR